MWLLLLFGLTCCSTSHAKAPRVLQPGTLPSDVRLGDLKTLNGHFPFVVPDNPAEWLSRAEALRRRVLVSNGLWPMPEKTPLNPVIHGKVQRQGFTVERVYFESLPGHYVTGLLFRPDQPAATPAAGVLCPHGHGGRLQRHSDQELARQISVGGEHFERSGRMPKIARCVQLARMGCVTFIFDMLGYADSIQISRTIAHRHMDAREEERKPTDKGWVLYSREADLRLQSIMGLQTWNAIRALDFLASLPDVDPDRLAVTGGSGGGTQSILLGAIDDRIKVSFPNGMVSTSMQGGCYCENCSYLRIGTGNVELAALFAPKPQAMTAANDWTKEMMSDGYPELKWLYAMLGDENDVYCRPMLHFRHNYNYVSRATMYQWMNRHLQLGLDEPIIENDSEPLSESEMKVWTDDHPAPTETGPDHERNVCRWLDEQSEAKLAALAPRDPESLDAFRKVLGGAWRVIFDLGMPAPDQVTYQQLGQSIQDGLQVSRGLLRDTDRNTELPLLTMRDPNVEDTGVVVVFTSGEGKNGAFTKDGKPSDVVKRITAKGATVLAADLLGQGEFNAADAVLTVQRLIDDPRSYSAFTFGYNRTLTAERCGDLLTVVAHANKRNDANVRLLATEGTAFWAAPAAALAGNRLAGAVLESAGERMGQADSYRDARFVPGAVKYGDVPVLLALRAPHPLSIVGEQQLPDIVRQSYQAAGASQALTHTKAKGIDAETIDRLLQ